MLELYKLVVYRYYVIFEAVTTDITEYKPIVKNDLDSYTIRNNDTMHMWAKELDQIILALWYVLHLPRNGFDTISCDIDLLIHSHDEPHAILIYAMKEWDKVFQTTKNCMFREWYQYSLQWVSVIWKMLKKDSSEVQDEFDQFLTRNIVNRIPEFQFEEDLFALDGNVDVLELQKVIERERYIEYLENIPEQAYTGDLFKDGDIYYLNIRAQCDLARKDDKVPLYLIKGKVLDAQDIVTEDIRLISEGELRFPNKVYTLNELQEICKSAADEKDGTVQGLEEINEQFRKYRNLVFFDHGEILEKKPEVILVCVDNGKIIKFRMDLVIKKFKEIKDKRVGRVLPPYITRIQQKIRRM